MSKISVPLLDLKQQYEPIRDEIRGVVDRVCDSQQFVLGPEVEALENEIARYTGVSEAVGVSSGTDALLLALMALGVEGGQEVIMSPYTFFATGGAVVRAGAVPVFCDIDPVTYNLAPEAVERFIARQCRFADGELVNKLSGNRVAAIIPVHLYGQVADMDRLMSIARDNNLRVIEDAAQAIGAEDGAGRRAGSFGDVGCFSFFPTKNLGAFGDAGMCVAADGELAERMRILRVHGAEPKYYHSLIGGNFRIDALQAAVLRVKLRHLDEWTEARRRNAGVYDAAFQDTGILTPAARPGWRHIYNQYVIRVERRDELRRYMADRGIGTEIYYPVPLHMQACFEYLEYEPDDCPESRRAGETTLALPVFPELTDEQLRHVADTVRAFYA